MLFGFISVVTAVIPSNFTPATVVEMIRPRTSQEVCAKRMMDAIVYEGKNRADPRAANGSNRTELILRFEANSFTQPQGESTYFNQPCTFASLRIVLAELRERHFGVRVVSKNTFEDVELPDSPTGYTQDILILVKFDYTVN